MRWQLVIFDWDGTLVDSADKIVRCCTHAARDTGLPVPTPAAIRRIIGLGLAEAVAELFPAAEHDQHQALMACYREYFNWRDKTRMPLFDGVEQGLARLRQHGVRLAVATGKSRRGLQRALTETGLEDLFCATRCADEAPSKPHPQMIHDILSSTGAGHEGALMVGDTIYDVDMAHRAGIAPVAVSYGVHPRDELMARRPVTCLDDFDEVCTWILRAFA